MKTAIVVPTVRPECIREFLEAWRTQFASHEVLIVEDGPEPTFSVPDSNVRHFSWADIDAEFGSQGWIFPRKTDCIRSYGFYKAWQLQPEMIVTLDDDCFPRGEGFIEDHFRQLEQPAISRGWVSTGSGAMPRGVPYDTLDRECECILNHSLWTNAPDLDAITVLANKRQAQEFIGVSQTVPKGMYFPMCGMNVAWKPELTPAMYFLLMGADWPFDRWGDIWCGVMVKKICDHLNLGVKSGDPYVEHRKKSNQWTNLARESSGYKVNETFWQAVDSIVLSASDIQGAYKQIAESLPLEGEYWSKLRQAMHVWADIFCEAEIAKTASATSSGSVAR
jgi:reversibly glycosylated polypeptide/UDP-arabinopyranose mutase